MGERRARGKRRVRIERRERRAPSRRPAGEENGAGLHARALLSHLPRLSLPSFWSGVLPGRPGSSTSESDGDRFIPWWKKH